MAEMALGLIDIMSLVSFISVDGERLDTFPLVIMFVAVKFNLSQFGYNFEVR